MKDKDWFDKGKDVAQIISLIAIPVLVAIFGWWLQDTMKDKEIRRDYIQIATGILSNPTADEKLRLWATQVIQDNSPTPFGQDVVSRLQLPGSGFAVIPRVPAPHVEAMEDPGQLTSMKGVADDMKRWRGEIEKALERDQATQVDTLNRVLQESIDKYQEASSLADKHAVNLRYLQNWARMITNSQGIIPGTEGRSLFEKSGSISR